MAIDETAYLDSHYAFRLYQSRAAVGLRIGRGSACSGTMFEVGPKGQVGLGAYVSISGPWVTCDAEVQIGDYALIAWNTVLMDTYRRPFDP